MAPPAPGAGRRRLPRRRARHAGVRADRPARARRAVHPAPPRRRHGRRARRARGGDGGDRRPRLGRLRGLARGADPARSLPGRRRPERALRAPRAHAAHPRARRRGRATTSCTCSTSRRPAWPRPSWRPTCAPRCAACSTPGPETPRPTRAGGQCSQRARGCSTGRTDPATLPAWLTAADLDFYTGEFERTGFRGGLNWYRNLDRTWELMAAYARARVTRPALFVAGDRDLVIALMSRAVDRLGETVPDLRKVVLLPAAATGPSRSAPGKSTPSCWRSCATWTIGSRDRTSSACVCFGVSAWVVYER